MLFLVKLQVQTRNFTKSNTPPWVFFAFFKIVQMVTNRPTYDIFLQISSVDNKNYVNYRRPDLYN